MSYELFNYELKHEISQMASSAFGPLLTLKNVAMALIIVSWMQ